jgi:hypothetical protein
MHGRGSWSPKRARISDVDPRNSIALALQAAQLEHTTQVEDVCGRADRGAGFDRARCKRIRSSRRSDVLFVVGARAAAFQVVGNDGVSRHERTSARP